MALIDRPKKIIGFEVAIGNLKGSYDPNNGELKLYIKMGDLLPASLDEVSEALENIRPKEEVPIKRKKGKVVFKRPESP